jgi:hypothetical protein
MPLLWHGTLEEKMIFKIYKYQFHKYEGEIVLPEGFQALSLQVQDGVMTMWALINKDNPTRKYNYRVYATGDTVVLPSRYIGTVVDEIHRTVWHVWIDVL